MNKIDDLKEFVKLKHQGQFRKHGTPYYLHPFAVAQILKDYGFSREYQIAALFHDLMEDTNTTYQELIDLSSKDIADAVKTMTKHKGYKNKEYFSKIKENRIAIVVKIADRIHNLDESLLVNKEFREKYVKETEKYYIEMSNNSVLQTLLKEKLNIVKESLK